MEATQTFTAEEWKEHEQFVQMFRAAKKRKLFFEHRKTQKEQIFGCATFFV